MRRFACVFAFAPLLALADGDPPGTVVLRMRVGETVPVTAAPGANVLCDDTSVAVGEFTSDGNGFVIRAVHPGTTLCGVWRALETPGGLYRVEVTAAAADAGAAARAPADAGTTDGGD
jgi:hypothetical protein